MKEGYRAQNLMGVLDDLDRRSKIADAAITWRRSLLAGRYDEAANHLTTVRMLVDDYVRLHETSDNPSDTGSSSHTGGTADVVPD